MAVRNAMYQEEMKKFIMKLAGWDTHFVFDMVDWEARNHASKNLRGSKKMSIFKLEFELLVTFKHRSKYDRTVDNWCFRCKRFNEDFYHILRCQHAIPYRNKLMQQFNELCLKRTLLPIYSTKIQDRH